MIYLIGGAPRVGKSILGQAIAAKRNVGWISTDLLVDLLRLKNEDGVKTSWNAAPEAIAADAEWFFPYLERFVWGVSSQAESYLIEGVGFLPAQVAQLAATYPIRAVFIGRSQMSLEHFDQFPGRSRGYAGLPEALRRRIVQDVPRWSHFVRQEADRFGYPYVDMAGDFASRMSEAEAICTM
jgi:hypothetical protein